MNVPFIELKRYYNEHRDEFATAINEVLGECSYVLGDAVEDFEKNISNYLGVEAISCASGSDALLLALMARNIGPGDEVITTPFTFFATAGAVARLGARPVFVDIDKKTFNIDPQEVKKAVTRNTKAIIPVHIFGQSAAMDEILKIAKVNDLVVIEDACQAIGAEYKGRKVGTIGDFGCFSFYPTKNLGGFGDGGLITCKSKKDTQLVKKLRVHGSEEKYHHDVIGINSRLDSIQAAVLNVSLKYLDKLNSQRIKIAQKYHKRLGSVVKIPYKEERNKHVYHQYAILVEDREELIKFLDNEGIGNGIYYPLPLHLQKCFSYLGYKKGDLPVSEEVADKILSLPMFPQMKESEIDYVIERVLDFFIH